MAAMSQTKRLKEAGAKAGIPKNAIRVQHDRKFVGRHQTNRGTMVNLYEIHGSTGWVETHKFKGVTLDHLKAIAEQGYDVNFWKREDGRIQSVWFNDAGYDYTEEGEWVQRPGTVTDVREESDKAQRYLKELGIG